MIRYGSNKAFFNIQNRLTKIARFAMLNGVVLKTSVINWSVSGGKYKT